MLVLRRCRRALAVTTRQLPVVHTAHRLAHTMAHAQIATASESTADGTGLVNSMQNASIKPPTTNGVDYIDNPSDSPAIKYLESLSIAYEIVKYDYVPKGGSKASSEALSHSHHWIIKTLIFKNKSTDDYFCVLMHGDYSVDTKKLSQWLTKNYKLPAAADSTTPAPSKISLTFATEEQSENITHYKVGGTSPFGLSADIPVFIEQSVVEGHSAEDAQQHNLSEEDRTVPPTVIINGGGRGLLVAMAVQDILKAVKPQLVHCGKPLKRTKDIEALKQKSSDDGEAAK